MNLNKIFLLGRVVADPAMYKSASNGASIAKFTVATSQVYKKSDGTTDNSAEFHNIVCFGKLADLVKEHVSKGQLVFVEGKSTTSNWVTKDNVKRYSVEVIAENVQFGPRSLRSRSDDPNMASGSKSSPGGKNESLEETEDGLPVINQDEDIDVSQIPF